MADIVLKNKDGDNVVYEGINSVSFTSVNGDVAVYNEGGTGLIQTDETLSMVDGVLSVNCAHSVEDNNTLPITAAAVYASVGNVEVLLKTI